MKWQICNILVVLLAASLFAQETPQHSTQRQSQHPVSQPATAPQPDSDDIQQLRTDVQRLRALLSQMRNNLAFVQTSQTPLKHQFELEADAWQVIVEQMDRRLKRMEDNTGRVEPQH